MKVRIKKKPGGGPAKAPGGAAPFLSAGMWGVAAASHAADNSADVILDNGFKINAPVASREWVTHEGEGREAASGGRDLPPAGSRVFVFMPYGGFDGCFVMPFSGYPDGFVPSLAVEGEEGVKKRVTPGGWVFEAAHDGSFLSVMSPGNGIIIETRANGGADVKAGDTLVEITPGGKVRIETGEIRAYARDGVKVETEGDAQIKAGGNAAVEAAGDAEIKGANVTVEASGELTLKTGDAAAWFPNVMPACPLGPVHGGAGAGVLKLKGA